VFEKIYLDPYYADSVARIAFQEKICEPTSVFDLATLEAPRNPLRKKTLLLLTLFKEVYLTLNNQEAADKLADYGILPPEKDRLVHQGLTTSEQTYYAAHDIVINMLKVSKRVLLRTHVQEWPNNYYVLGSKPTSKEKRQHQEFQEFNRKLLRYWGKLSLRELNQQYDRYIDYRLAHQRLDDECETKGDIKEASFFLRIHIDQILASLSVLFEQSLINSVQVISRFARKHPPVQNTQSTFDDIVCISQAMLRDEIRILPNPSCLKEVVELRQRSEIARFRDVVSEWFDTIQEGRVDIEKKIRRDIATANQDLRRLRSWQEYKESPIAFWINAIGGHIPLFSNLLTFISTFGDRAFSKWVTKKSGWAMLIQ